MITVMAKRAVEAATLQAARVPLSVAVAAADAADLAAEAIEIGNVNAISDAASAVALARAAFQAASLNVRVNAKQLADPSPIRNWEESLGASAARLDQAEARTRAGLKLRAGIEGLV